MYSKNERIARNSSYKKNEAFREEGHELHKMRTVIHKLCVDAVGYENWTRNHNCPIKMFSEELEKLISNAVDLSNWAAIENYDPLEGY